MTYSFPRAQWSSADWASNRNHTSHNKPARASDLTPTQQQAVREALATWSNVEYQLL